MTVEQFLRKTARRLRDDFQRAYHRIDGFTVGAKAGEVAP
jgi:hypothetical protein